MRRMMFLFVVGTMAGAVLASDAQADEKKKTQVKIVSAVDIEEEVGGKKMRATTIELTLPPGAAGTPHRHPGAVFGYVLEGTFEFATGDEKPRTLKAGDTFYEPAMILHRVSRNPSTQAKARVLALMVHPRDAKELSIPEPAQKGK